MMPAADTFNPTREMVDAVAAWREKKLHDRAVRPIIPLLRERFNLDNKQACAVLRDPRVMHMGGADANAS